MELTLDLVQRQTLSQRMVQTMEILQMSAQELETYLEALSLENPVIELDTQDTDTESQKEIEFQRKLDWLESGDLQNRIYYQQDRDSQNPEHNWNNATDEQVVLKDHLLSQLLLSQIKEEDLKILRFLMDSLDDRGYFTEDITYVAAYFHSNPTHIESLLKVIQSLEPCGVGARDLKECLLLQLQRLHEQEPITDYELVQTLIQNHLDDIAKNHYHDISKRLQISMERIDLACQKIRSLNPKPGSIFSHQEQLRYIVPDVIITLVEDRFEILINEHQYPSFTISGYYKHMLDTTDDAEAKDYLQKKIRQAEWVQSCITQRSSTLKRVVSVLMERQLDFFLHGRGHRAPLRLTDIAEELNLHESTISRALRGKYLQCSWGVFPLNYFLVSVATKTKASSSTEEAQTPEYVKSKLQELIQSEDKQKPYSDQHLSDRLTAMGIPISRRTVNKYRTELGIPDKAGRKHWN